MHPFINKASQAARKAGRIICQTMDRLDRLDIKDKGGHALASNADRAAETAIIDVLHTAYPNHSIIGKELGHAVKGDEDVTWFVDALDGSMNFLNGVPHFAVSIACQSADRIEHGLVFDPVRQEEFSASHHQGTLLNQRRIRVGNKQRLHRALVADILLLSEQAEDSAALDGLALKIKTTCHNIRCSGCASLDLAYVAAGRFDAAFGANIKPWNLLAGALLIQEAGGLVAGLDGSPDGISSGNISAGSPKCFHALAAIIQNQGAGSASPEQNQHSSP